MVRKGCLHSGIKLGKVADRLLQAVMLPILAPIHFIQGETSETCSVKHILYILLINKMQLIACISANRQA